MHALSRRIAAQHVARQSPPSRLYHATPYPDQILREGFKPEKSIETLGAPGQEHYEYVSLTNRDRAIQYGRGLAAAIGGLSLAYSWEEWERIVTETLGCRPSNWREAFDMPFIYRGIMRDLTDLQRFESDRDRRDWVIEQVYEEVSLTGRRTNADQEQMRRWHVLKEVSTDCEALPAFVGTREPPDHLTDPERRPEEVAVLEVNVATSQLDGDDAEWYGREEEWRIYDSSVLDPTQIIWTGEDL
jgi:hypothetical protein